MIAFALGPMGWSYENLYYTPPVHFFAAMAAYLTHEDKKQKALYEIIRMHATTILNSFSKKTIQPESVMRFRWDEIEEVATPDRLRDNKILQMWASNPPTRAGEKKPG